MEGIQTGASPREEQGASHWAPAAFVAHKEAPRVLK